MAQLMLEGEEVVDGDGGGGEVRAVYNLGEGAHARVPSFTSILRQQPRAIEPLGQAAGDAAQGGVRVDHDECQANGVERPQDRRDDVGLHAEHEGALQHGEDRGLPQAGLPPELTVGHAHAEVPEAPERVGVVHLGEGGVAACRHQVLVLVYGVPDPVGEDRPTAQEAAAHHEVVDHGHEEHLQRHIAGVLEDPPQVAVPAAPARVRVAPSGPHLRRDGNDTECVGQEASRASPTREGGEPLHVPPHAERCVHHGQDA
mmetsp:Transcript_3224/g.6393  ORF Transcript_3224/g.6393 Transcript_3224/m.6393 type:complete len:258 (+) Transcript_3224:684-1457(+)